LRNRGLVAFPTETVYGLGAQALEPAAVARIFAAKGRPATNPLIVHVTTIAEAQQLVAHWPRAATLLAERFWPGPLTIVLPRASRVPDLVTAGGDTVAVRMPRHPVARALIEAVGAPIAAPSANASSRISPTSAEHVLRTLEGRIDMVLDGGPTSGGIESTVIDLCDLDANGNQPRLLRPGLIAVAQLEAALGTSVQLANHTEGLDRSEILPSPGMLARHYAPLVPVELLPYQPYSESAANDVAQRVSELEPRGERVGWITREAGPREVSKSVPTQNAAAQNFAGDEHVICLELAADPAGYAAQLYAALHTCEAAGVARIIIELPPEDPEWLAVLDRLRRASCPA
jgi:L-threonylcarbamoyladenylate synthase